MSSWLRTWYWVPSHFDAVYGPQMPACGAPPNWICGAGILKPELNSWLDELVQFWSP